MDADQARTIALRVSQRVNPGRHYVSLTVEGGDDATYAIWTTSGGRFHEQKLAASVTSEERLEKHLVGFVDNWRHRVL